MYEVFFFVNPIGINCYKSEREIISAINESKKKVVYHFVPMANLTTIRSDIQARNLENCNVDLFNSISTHTFNAMKDYHALKLIKGNKAARKFLLQLQKTINDDKEIYSFELVEDILNKLNISVDKFLQTRESAYTQLSINKDLSLVKELKVETTPTTFVFNYDCDNCGVMIEGSVTRDKIAAALSPDVTADAEHCFNPSGLHLL
ncbi:putative DsbA family dithiol-disulfide isomerase [Lactobacillus colini]|uniref:DsbA family dithiol-disulfide isomerase n=1 Tax=Lactobacillus colini TaxID=1819254 RepID=A0ABS4ME42_9LACO|nr:DsbA family protein [Lactobacillus colini]MBP2057616.1 putative DsbA family dithiol-disulfide isomerase [Lactobacillus colini]